MRPSWLIRCAHTAPAEIIQPANIIEKTARITANIPNLSQANTANFRG